jgi:hypothetical protein
MLATVLIELLVVALGLGLAGLDPAGALVAAGALGGGARERHVAAYGLVALLGTVAFGATLSLTVGPRVAEIDWVALASLPAAAVIEAVLGLGLVAWGVARALRPATRAPKPRSTRGTGPTALVAAGTLFALSAILDPTFVSLAVIAGRDGTFWSVVAAHSVWVLVSQAPLVLLLAAMAGGAHGRFVARFRSWWEKVRPAVGRLVTGAALLAGAFFLLDSGWWFVTGEFLVGG